MIVDIALGIVLGAAILFAIVLVGPSLLGALMEFIGQPVVYWLIVGSLGLAALGWLGEEHPWVVTVVLALVAVGALVALLVGFLVVVRAARDWIRELRGGPSRAHLDMLAKRRALGYEA